MTLHTAAANSVESGKFTKNVDEAENMCENCVVETGDKLHILCDFVTRENYYKAAFEFSDFSLYQTWDFATIMAEDVGGSLSTILVRRGEKTVGMAAMRVRRIPFSKFGVAYCLCGPLWRRDGEESTALGDVLAAIRREYGDRRGYTVRLRPRVFMEDTCSENVQKLLRESGFERDVGASVQRTFRLDLGPSLDEIRSGLQRRWRNYLAQAERRGLELITNNTCGAYESFLTLYNGMKQRKQFDTGVDPVVYRRIHDALPDDLKMETTLALLDGEVVAAHVASHLGDTCLGLLAATSVQALHCRAANLVWWERFRRAKLDGRRYYDLGGYDFKTNPKGAETKAKLGGEGVTYIGEYFYAPSRVRGVCVSSAVRCYRAIRRVLRLKQ